MNKKIIILISAYINYIFQGMGALILSLSLNNLKDSWQATTFQVSMVIGGIGLGRILFMYISGVISDKYGRKRTILLSSILYSLFFCLISFSPNYILAFCLTVMAGFCHALYDTSIYPLITELYPNEKLQGSLSILNKAFISFGQFILPIILVQLTSKSISFHYVYILCALGVLINLIIFAFLPVNSAISKVVKAEESKGKVKINKQSMMLFAFSFISVSLFTIFTTWVATYGTDYLHLTSAKSALYVSVYSVCSIISVFLTSFVVRLGVKKLNIILVCLVMTFLGLLVVNIWPSSMTLLFATLMIGIFAAGGIWQLGLVELLEQVPGFKGQYTSYYSLSASVALFIIPNFTGYLAEMNIASVFVLNNVLALIGIVLVLVLNKKKEN